MNMKIIWTPRARNDFVKILSYLGENWDLGVVRDFIEQAEAVIGDISENPKMFKESLRRKHVHKAFVTKHNSLFYLVKTRKKEIILLTFWDNRKDPRKNPF